MYRTAETFLHGVYEALYAPYGTGYNYEGVNFGVTRNAKGLQTQLNRNTKFIIKIDGKGYSVPAVDCVFLPLPYTSAEELSKFFAETLAKKLSETYDNLEYVSVCVNEGIGQGAMYRKDIE